MRTALLVAWLGLALVPSGAAEAQPPARTCWCFHWVHGRDCFATLPLCERERGHRGRGATACEARRERACAREGFVDGRRLRVNERDRVEVAEVLRTVPSPR